MPLELELKAVVPDPDDLRDSLRDAGAVLEFRGRMTDRRFDREGELSLRDEVLRVRTFHPADGTHEAIMGWKGPTGRSADGYKLRQEIELPLQPGADDPARLLGALGYRVVQVIDREIELYRLGDVALRLERYPRMDLLLEVEGDPAGIERAVALTGLPRATFTADPLAEFVRRYELRTGEPACLAINPAAPDRPPGSP